MLNLLSSPWIRRVGFLCYEKIWIEQKSSLSIRILMRSHVAPSQPKIYNLYIPTVTGVSVYHAQETSHLLWRYLCFPYHSFHIAVSDSKQKTLLELHRPYRCCCPSLCSCCQKEMTVVHIADDDERKTIGYIQEPILGGFWRPKLRIYREKFGPPIGDFRGPCLFIGGCLCASDARINSLDNKEVVSINKGGVVRDIEVRRSLLGTPPNQYHVSFEDPLLPYDDKLTFLATILFSDYLFFPGESHGEYTGRSYCRWGCPPQIFCKLCGVYCCGITFPIMLSCCFHGTIEEEK